MVDDRLTTGAVALPVRIARNSPHGAVQRPRLSLEQIATRNLGEGTARHRVLDVLRFVLLWDLAIALAHTSSIDLREFATFWGEPVRTAYRWQAAFRKAFPGEETPIRMLAVCNGYERSAGIEALAAMKVHVMLADEPSDEQVGANRIPD